MIKHKGCVLLYFTGLNKFSLEKSSFNITENETPLEVKILSEVPEIPGFVRGPSGSVGTCINIDHLIWNSFEVLQQSDNIVWMSWY